MGNSKLYADTAALLYTYAAFMRFGEQHWICTLTLRGRVEGKLRKLHRNWIEDQLGKNSKLIQVGFGHSNWNWTE